MPAYNTQVPPPALYPGYPCNTGLAFNGDDAKVTGPSQQFHLSPGAGFPLAALPLSVELKFSADPGVFEIDVQTADTDTTDAFTNLPSGGALNTATAGPFGAFYSRLEIPGGVRANFVRLNRKTAAGNVCTVIGKISR